MKIVPLIAFCLIALLVVSWMIDWDHFNKRTSFVFFAIVAKLALLMLAVLASLALLHPIIHVAVTGANTLRITISLFLVVVAMGVKFTWK